jgi:hypothetical protein
MLSSCDDDMGKAALGETDTKGSDSGEDSGDGENTGAGEDTGEDTGDGEDTGNDGPPPPITFDVGNIPDGGEAQRGCRAVDFLFVIDNSGSMYTMQQNLVDNFPTFIDGIQSTLTDVDSFHVGVVTSDAYAPNANGCDELGGLVVETGGSQSSADTCGPYAEGNNFMTEADDLASSFACAAQVGTSGNNYELTMEAMERAIDGSLAGPNQCNFGFVRDNALLVVVIITDEADGPDDPDGISNPGGTSSGDPMSWYQTVVAAKADRPENAAILSLVNYEGSAECAPYGDTDDGKNIVEFTQMFGENGFVGGICEADYGPIFTQAVGVVETACENFVPPG